MTLYLPRVSSLFRLGFSAYKIKAGTGFLGSSHIREKMRLEDIEYSEIRPFFDSLTTELDSFGTDVSRLLKQAVYIKGVRRNGQLAGLGGLQRTRFFSKMLLTFHIVKKDFQGQGVANEITKAFLEYAKQSNISVVFASVFNTNTASLQMTVRQGYKWTFRDKTFQWMYIPLNRKGEVIAHLVMPLLRIYSLLRLGKE